MKKILLIIQREYLTRVRKRAFIVTTLLVPILFVGAFIGITFITSSSEENLSIAVKDDSGLFENKIRGMDKSNLTFQYFGPHALPKDSLRNAFGLMNFDGLLYIPSLQSVDLAAENYLPSISYYADYSIGYKTKLYVETELSKVIRAQVIKTENLDEAVIERLENKLEIQSIIGDETESSAMTGIATAIGYLTGFIIYIYLFAYGAMVMRSIMEEKTNRIVEVIITTVRPFQLMMGKILGIGAVGFTQLVIWGIVFNGLYLAAAWIIGIDMDAAQSMPAAEMAQFDQEDIELMAQEIFAGLSLVNWGRVILSFLFYFFFGYILYASQFAAVGAAVTDDGDVQTMMFPISIPIILSIIIMVTTIEQPNSGLSFWSSLIPFTSPVVMMSRIPFGISWWEQLLSMAILASTSLVMVWLAGKIYRIGILIQGQKPSLRKMWGWLWS